MGIPPSELAARLPYRDFVDFQLYAAKRQLPGRRMELHLAQISLLIAKTMGKAENVSLDDFLFDAVELEEMPAEDVAGYFNFNPMNRKD